MRPRHSALWCYPQVLVGAHGYALTKSTDPSPFFFFYRFLIAVIFLLSPKSHLLIFPTYKTGLSGSSQASHTAWGTTSFVPSFYTYIIGHHDARKTLVHGFVKALIHCANIQKS